MQTSKFFSAIISLFSLLSLLGAATLMAASTTVGARELDKVYDKNLFQVGAEKVHLYVADSETKRSEGLMFVTTMAEDTGMLFVFEGEQALNFWMKNTLIPLDIGFFNAHGVLIDVQEMKVPGSVMELAPPSYQSRGPALYALEMNVGWFHRHKIKSGVALRLLEKAKSELLNQQLNKKSLNK